MLKRVSIQNFKSLKDVKLDLQKVNLLIGPNNSGKTNFLKALEFIEFQAIQGKMDNFERLIYNQKDGSPFLRLGLKYLTQEPKTFYNFYNIEMSGRQGEDYTEFWGWTNTDIDEAEIWDVKKLDKDFDFFELNVSDDSFSSYAAYHEYAEANPSILANTGLFKVLKQKSSLEGSLPEERGKLFHSFTKNLSFRKDFIKDNYYPFNNIKIYKPDPIKFITPAELGSDDVVKGDCSNIISFLFNLGQNHKKKLAELEKDFEKCVGDLSSIGTPSVKTESGNKLRLKFFDKYDNSYWADEVSEGVLYFLALLCIINQPNPPKLLLLEEPEKGIHPRRIREVMDFIFRLAEEKDVQIILTTHNEHVLDDFSTRPESVFVFDKDEEGATYVRNLQKDIIEPTNQRNRELGLDEIDLTTNLSDNWLYGLLGGVPTIP